MSVEAIQRRKFSTPLPLCTSHQPPSDQVDLNSPASINDHNSAVQLLSLTPRYSKKPLGKFIGSSNFESDQRADQGQKQNKLQKGQSPFKQRLSLFYNPKNIVQEAPQGSSKEPSQVFNQTKTSVGSSEVFPELQRGVNTSNIFSEHQSSNIWESKLASLSTSVERNQPNAMLRTNRRWTVVAIQGAFQPFNQTRFTDNSQQSFDNGTLSKKQAQIEAQKTFSQKFSDMLSKDDSIFEQQSKVCTLPQDQPKLPTFFSQRVSISPKQTSLKAVYQTTEHLNHRQHHEHWLQTMRDVRAEEPETQNAQMKNKKVALLTKMPSKTNLNSTLTKEFQIQKLYQTDGKESIYKTIDGDISYLASGGLSEIKKTSRTEERKHFLTKDGKHHKLTKIYFKKEQSPAKKVHLLAHNMDEVFDECRIKIMGSLEQKILDKNERVREIEEAASKALQYKIIAEMRGNRAREKAEQKREFEERFKTELEEERVRTQPVKEFLVDYRHMQSTRHRLQLLEKQDQLLYYAGLARLL